MCNFVNVDESDAKQEKPVLNFTGEKCGSCGDDDPVYNCGKLKSACVDESDANQEKPAFTVEMTLSIVMEKYVTITTYMCSM